jgi:hypothetical protein
MYTVDNAHTKLPLPFAIAKAGHEQVERLHLMLVLLPVIDKS